MADTPPARKRPALRLAIAYAVVAGLWIALSDRMLVGINDPSLTAQIATFKGFAFVAVTASLLYLALRFGVMPTVVEPPPAALPENPRRGRLVVVFLLLSMVIAVVGYLAFRVQTESLRNAEAEQLRGIAELKAAQIEGWLAERRADAEIQGRSMLLRETLRRWQAGRDPALRAQLLDRLAVMRESRDYASVELFGPAGDRLVAEGEVLPDADGLHGLLKPATNANDPLLLDLHAHGNRDKIRLAFVSPVRDEGAPGRPAMGFLVMTIDPARFLYPLIQSWPGPSASAETLLVRRDGDDVLFLNELRHRKDTALTLRFPLTQTETPAVRAVLGGADVVEGPDYRKVPVLAAVRPIRGTPWHLVAKVDQGEVFRDTERLGIFTALLVAAAILVTGLLVNLLWRQQRLREALARSEQARALTDAEMRFRATFDQAAVGLAHVALDGAWLQVNRKLCAIVGYSHEELRKMRFQDITHPDDLAADLEGARRMQAGEADTHRAEKRYFHKDGHIVWIHLTVSIVRDGERNPEYFVVVIEDISARKAVEARVAKLDNLYRALSEAGQSIVRAEDETTLFKRTCEIATRLGSFPLVWIAVHDPATDELVAVAAAGRAAEGFVGFRISVDPAHPTGRGPASRAFQAGKQVVCNDFLADPDTVLWHDAARKSDIRSTVSLPLRREGELAGMLNISSSRVGYFDPEVMDLLEGMAENVCYALDHLAHQEGLRRTMAELRQTQGSLERRVQERTAELSQALARAEGADRVKSTFLATMSHELRTPLNSILGFTGVLLRGLPGPLNEEQTKQLAIVKTSGEHLLALINDVLDISRIEAGELTLKPEPYNLRALLERVAAGAAVKAAEQNLSFELALAPGLDSAFGDPRRMEQVVANLLANAINFTEQGGLRLAAQVADKQAEISVEDTGVGIAEADRPKLFLPFAQIGTGLMRGQDGTGLGLAISHRLVRAMGGDIRVLSAEGVGSTFTVTLPLEATRP